MIPEKKQATLNALLALLDTEIEQLREALSATAPAARTDLPAALDMIDALKAENERLRAALAFYADEATWRTSVIPGVGVYCETSAALKDNGQRAHSALTEGASDD